MSRDIKFRAWDPTNGMVEGVGITPSRDSKPLDTFDTIHGAKNLKEENR